jgi:(p)ppGpp synthase/HD superfamily hydrolase
MDRLLEAISYAARQHAGQLRKDGCTPYVAHVFRVMTILAREFGVLDDELLTAAVLHDTLEDTSADYDELEEHFGRTVAQYVAALSKDCRLPEPQREAEYTAALQSAPWQVQLCKVADLLDNLRDTRINDDPRRAQLRARLVARASQLLDALRPTLQHRWGHALRLLQDELAAHGA